MKRSFTLQDAEKFKAALTRNAHEVPLPFTEPEVQPARVQLEALVAQSFLERHNDPKRPNIHESRKREAAQVAERKPALVNAKRETYRKLAQSLEGVTRKSTRFQLMAQEKALSALELAQKVLEQVPPSHGLGESALEVYAKLCEVAYTDFIHHQSEALHSQATQHTFFHSLELMAECLGYSRSWFSEILGKLKACNLLTHAPHVATCADGNKNDGTLFALCLRPAEAFREGARAPRLEMAHFCHSYRNLEKDRKNKHTFYYVKKLFLDLTGHSRRQKDKRHGVNFLTNWTLNPVELIQNPANSLNVRSDAPKGRYAIYALEDALHAAPEDRGEVVRGLAHQLGIALGDSSEHGHKFYMLVLWRLVKLAELGSNLFSQVQALLERCLTDSREGFARNTGALFASRLKSFGIWDHLKAVKRVAYRVEVGA